MIEDKKSCSARVYGSRSGGYPCQKQATIERDGKWFCTVHDPEYIKTKQAKWQAKFDKKYMEDTKRYELMDARKQATQGLTLQELRQVTPELIRNALKGIK